MRAAGVAARGCGDGAPSDGAQHRMLSAPPDTVFYHRTTVARVKVRKGKARAASSRRRGHACTAAETPATVENVEDGIVNLKVETTNQDGALVLSGYAAARVD